MKKVKKLAPGLELRLTESKKALKETAHPAAVPCPACGAHTVVTDTRRTKGVACRRRRLCIGEGRHRFTTYEVAANKTPDDVEKVVGQMIERLESAILLGNAAIAYWKSTVAGQ